MLSAGGVEGQWPKPRADHQGPWVPARAFGFGSEGSREPHGREMGRLSGLKTLVRRMENSLVIWAGPEAGPAGACSTHMWDGPQCGVQEMLTREKH